MAGVDVVDRQRVRFRLKEPWPDFMAFYGTPATGAGWIVPRKYLEKVGDEGFKKAPIGAGPYKFVSFNPGVELVLEAHAAYWRKTPSVKRLVLRVVPDESTRLAMLKNGEVDIAYSIRGALAEELRRSPGLTLKATYLQGTYWVLFADQWDPKSPWADRRVRLAASHSMNRKGLIDAETLGLAKTSGSIIPQSFDFYWPAPPPPAYDPAQAKKLLAEAGFPQGFDAGDYTCDTSYSNIAETIINDFRTIGIRTRLRPLERAGFFKEYAEKKLKNVIQGSSGAYGTAATRVEAFVAAGGAYVYGTYPDIEGPSASRGRCSTARSGSRPCIHPAAPARQGRLRADLGAGAAERPRAPRGGRRPRADLESRLLGPVRGPAPEEAVSTPARRCVRRLGAVVNASRPAPPAGGPAEPAPPRTRTRS